MVENHVWNVKDPDLSVWAADCGDPSWVGFVPSKGLTFGFDGEGRNVQKHWAACRTGEDIDKTIRAERAARGSVWAYSILPHAR